MVKRGLSRGVVLVLTALCATLALAQGRSVATQGLGGDVRAPRVRVVVAQRTAENPSSGTPAVPLPSLSATISREEAQAITMAPNDEFSQALRLVIHLLQLRADQVEGLKQLLQLRRQAVVPLLQAIAEGERQLRELIESGGDPPTIGQLVLEIHHYYQLIARAQADFFGRL